MASIGTGTSFRQYHLCSLCKVNHTNGKKHIYSKRHQTILQSILKKFSDKIQSVRKDLFNPKVNSIDFENGAKFWCYFCKEEKPKHDVLENCTVIGAGILEHITCKDHRSNMDQFFYNNLLKKELKPRYVLSLEDLYIFKKAAFLAVKKWQKNDEVSRKVVAESIAVTEHKRLSESTSRVSSLNHEERVSLENMPGTSGTSQSSSQGNNMINNRIRKTVSAIGEGLTCVLRQDNEDREEGNVHTGALPPWLTPDTTNNHTTQIGPTIEDYQKHLEREKKAKLPPNRVGAKFDHTADMSSDWLPSFGRVWSKGRRLQSKQHFEKNWKKGSKSIGNSRKSQTSDHVGSSSKAGVTFHKEKSDWSEYKSGANQNQLSSNSATLNYSNFSSSNHTVPYKRQNRNELDVKSSVIDGNYDHSNNTSNHTVPYKRKNTEQNATASVIGGIHSGSTSSDSIQPIIPYKRKRNNNSCNSVNLIHTPVLSESDRK